MDTGSNAPGTRPVNFVFLSSEAQPLQLDGTDRRFWIVDAAKVVPVAALEAAGGDLDKAVQAYNDWLPRQLAVDGDALLARAEQHASHTAPKCVDCAHYDRGDKMFGNGPYCTHPAAPVDPVTGYMTTRAAQARSARAGAICGVAGRLFVPRDGVGS